MPFVRKILLTRKHDFDLMDVSSALNVKSRQSRVYVNKMMALGLIKECEVGKSSDVKLYNVIDPKLKYLISRGIMTIEN